MLNQLIIEFLLLVLMVDKPLILHKNKDFTKIKWKLVVIYSFCFETINFFLNFFWQSINLNRLSEKSRLHNNSKIGDYRTFDLFFLTLFSLLKSTYRSCHRNHLALGTWHKNISFWISFYNIKIRYSVI